MANALLLRTFFALLCCAFALCGCATALGFREKPKEADVRSDLNEDRLSLVTTRLLIRAFELGPDGGYDQEVEGAVCVLKSGEISAEILTPRRVSVPTFKRQRRFPEWGKPSTIFVTCRGNGKVGETQVKPIESQIPDVPVPGGMIADLVTVAAHELMGEATPWVYPRNVEVELNPAPESGDTGAEPADR